MKTNNKNAKYKRDDRLSFWNNFLYEFGLIFLIIFVNSYCLIMLYNRLIRANIDVPLFSVFIILFLFVFCTISSVFVYITRARVYSRNIQMICKAAQRVASGDFDVHLETFPEKPYKNELDILKEDFNKMVAELSSVEGLKDDFVADVSHEIKTPLSVIQGYAGLLQTPGISEETRNEYISLISEAIHNLSELVTNILKLNKIENQGIIQKEKFFLDEQIRCAVLGFENKFEEENISVKVELQEVVVIAEQTSLMLVWNNLISNALKFTPNGGELFIGLKEENGIAAVTVKDNGCGMTEETQKHIFKKFYQGESSHSVAGNGLGLPLVKKIINLSGGTIEVKSEINKGTEFVVKLPL